MDSLRLNVCVSLVAIAIVSVCQVVHDVVPGLACDASKQQHDRLEEVSEVVVAVVCISVLYVGKQADSEHTVNKDQQKHQQHDVRDLRQNVHKCIDDKTTKRLKESEHSQNSERPNDCGCHRNIDPDIHYTHDDADVGSDYNHSVKQIPS